MKTRSIARGIVGSVAALLGVMAAGCSADVAPGDSAEIGSTEQAISNTDITSLTAFSAGSGVAHHSACTITIGSDRYVIVAGGQTASAGPTYTSDAQVLKVTGTKAWTRFASKLPAALAFGAMLPDPNDSAACLYFGGEQSNGTKSTAVRKLKLAVDGSGNPSTLTASTVATMTGRSHHEIIPCGTSSSKILIAGGVGALTSLEVYDNGSVSTLVEQAGLGGSNVALSTGRSDFAMASVDVNRIAVFGGKDTNGSDLSSIEVLSLDNDCKTNLDGTTAKVSPATLSTARHGLKAFYKSTSSSQDNFMVVAGEAGSTASNVDDEIKITFSDPTNVLTSKNDRVANGTNVPQAAAFPAFAIISANRAVLAGGVSQNYVQEDNAGTWTSTNVNSSSASLPNRDGATATHVPGSNVVIVVGGFDGTNFRNDGLVLAGY